MRRVLSEGVEPEALARTAPLLTGLLLARRTDTQREHGHRSRCSRSCWGQEDALDTLRLLARAGVRSDGDYVVLVAAVAESAYRWACLRATQIAAADGTALSARSVVRR